MWNVQQSGYEIFPIAIFNNSTSRSFIQPIFFPLDPHPLTIVPGVETIIEINKGGSGLGLSIVGGSDTLLGVIIIHEVYEDGAAYQDGRLQSGNRVFWVAKQYSNRTTLIVYTFFFL